MRYKRADKGKQRDLSKNSSALTEQSTLSITETHTRVNTQTKTKIHFNAFQVYRNAIAPQQKVLPLKQHVH